MTLILVTGSSGFIGRYCVRKLVDKGYEVAGIDLIDPDNNDKNFLSFFIKGRINAETLDQLSRKYMIPNYIIHCAGSGSVSISLENPKLDFESNVLTSIEVLDFSRRNKSNIVVIIPSSAAVYGDINQEFLSENMFCQPVSPYGVHKLMVESLALYYYRHFSVPSICVRFFSVYGIGLKKQLLWDACHKAKTGKFSFFGLGDEKRDWIHVVDAAQILVLAVKKEANEAIIVNGGTGIGTSAQDILTLIGHNWSENSLQPTFNGQLRDGDPKNLIADITRLRAFGFLQTITVEQGVIDYINWYKLFYK
jgi:UDP-glucose 4-epimerase